MVRSENYVDLMEVLFDALLDVFAPSESIADLGATQGVEIMQVSGAVFCKTQRTELREIDIHLGRSLGTGR